MAPAIAEPPTKTRQKPRTIARRSLSPRPRAATRRPTRSSEATEPKSSDLIPQLINEHQASVWRYLRALGCPSDLAEDLTQETFLAAFARPFDYRGPAAAASYLRRSAYHRYISYLQKKRVAQVELGEIEINEATWSRWYQDNREHSEVVDILNECMAELPPKSRFALELRFRDGCSRQEIAEQLAMTEHGAKNLMQRAKKRLRQSIEMRLNGSTTG